MLSSISNSASSSSQSRSSSHIAVDLSQKTTPTALKSLSEMTKRMSKIKSALVYTSRAGVGIHRNISPQDVVQIFSVLGQMPNLTSLVVDMNRPHHYSGNGGLPLAALVKLLQSARRLQMLQLKQLDVTGASSPTASTTTEATTSAGSSDVTWKELSKCLARHKYLRKICVMNCMGKNISCVVGIVAKHARALRHLQLVGTSVSSYGMARLTDQNIHPHLTTLRLEELPDITDEQIAHLCSDLEKTNSKLRELHIRSSVLTEMTGDRLALMLCLNTSLETVVLHLDCERLANGMAHCLSVNTTLRSVDIRCYGDDEYVSQNVVQMAQSLHHSSLQKLRLCLEIEPLEYQQDIVNAFANMLLGDTNTSLQELILDDGIQTYPLSAELQLQLELNQCGYTRFIRTPNENAVSPQQWIQTVQIASDQDNLNALYTILSNCPWLICEAANAPACVTPQASNSKALMDNSSRKLDASSKRRRYGFGSRSARSRSPKRISSASNSPSSSHRRPVARTASGKTLKRMVKAILLAPSA